MNVASSNTTTSAYFPIATTPRSLMPNVSAVRALDCLTNCSGVRTFFPRTYSAHFFGNVPYLRGWPAEPSDPVITHGRRMNATMIWIAASTGLTSRAVAMSSSVRPSIAVSRVEVMSSDFAPPRRRRFSIISVTRRAFVAGLATRAQRVAATDLRPARQERRTHGRPRCRVRVLVGADLVAGVPCRLDDRDGRIGAAPDVGA